jgi:hypothetical protein
MEKHTDESVKTGLQIEANSNALKKNNSGGTGYQDTLKETDADDAVHEKKEEIISHGNEEQDIDELVHNSPVSKTAVDNEERDPDDLVHEREEFSDE